MRLKRKVSPLDCIHRVYRADEHWREWAEDKVARWLEMNSDHVCEQKVSVVEYLYGLLVLIREGKVTVER
jgi:hypothetical protein